MPSLNDIVHVAETLEKSPVLVVRDRCVAVRNRNASCRRCVAACPVHALSVRANEVTLDASTCVACGACAAACPTEALVPVAPAESAVREALRHSIQVNEGRAVVACARIASKRQADPASYAEVPCLSYVSETLVIDAAASGAARMTLVDGNCATCKNRMCLDALDVALDEAAKLLVAHGCDMDVQVVTGFPDELRSADAAGLHGSTRRGFFTEAASAAKETAMAAAKTTLESELGYKVDEASIGERLRVTESGTLPLLRMPRHESALDALDALGLPESGPVDSRLFGTVSIDASTCNACGMCAVFCPTGALARDGADAPSDPLRSLEFSAADCVQCGLCEDVCWKGALVLSPRVDASELYDFEPRVIAMPKQKVPKLGAFNV